MRTLKLAAQLALVSACVGASTNALAYTKTIISPDGGAKATFYWEYSSYLYPMVSTSGVVSYLKMPTRHVYSGHVYDLKCDGRYPKFRIGEVYLGGTVIGENGWDNTKGCRQNGYSDDVRSVSYQSDKATGYARICNYSVRAGTSCSSKIYSW